MCAARIPFTYGPEELRAMYRGQRGNATARRYARWWSTVFGWGLAPSRWVTLEVPGRTSGRLTRFPLGCATSAHERYLVSMLGDDCHWVKNVRANDGRAVIRHGRARPVQLEEVPAGDRAAILARYVAQVPGGRPHIPVPVGAPLSDFAAIASRYPVFGIVTTR